MTGGTPGAGADTSRGGSIVPLVLTGVAVCVLGAVTLLVHEPFVALNVPLFLGPGLLLLFGVGALHRSGVPPDRYRRITAWTAGGGAAVGGVSVLMILAPSIPIDEPAVATTLGVGVGAASGLVAGTNEARAIVRAERAARERVAAELAEDQRERLEWLNHLLRHDILNDATVIRAHADAIAAKHGESRHVEAIHRQVDAVSELISNVRAFLEAVEEDRPLMETDLAAVVDREVERIRSSYPDADVTVDLPAGATVLADDLLGSVFSNLLRNAVVHGADGEPVVRVTGSVDGETVTVRVADEGPGFPEHVREQPFEAAEGGDHGFGLYLVGRLTDRYGGSVAVESSGPSGSTVAVTLPLAETAREARDADAAGAATEATVAAGNRST